MLWPQGSEKLLNVKCKWKWFGILETKFCGTSELTSRQQDLNKEMLISYNRKKKINLSDFQKYRYVWDIIWKRTIHEPNRIYGTSYTQHSSTMIWKVILHSAELLKRTFLYNASLFQNGHYSFSILSPGKSGCHAVKAKRCAFFFYRS